MMGVNIISYSHFDEYLVDFTSFKAGAIAAAEQVFAVPGQCKEKQQQQEQQQGQGSRGGAAAGLLGTLAAMPWVHLPGEQGRAICLAQQYVCVQLVAAIMESSISCCLFWVSRT
jgi:hypothetical protein